MDTTVEKKNQIIWYISVAPKTEPNTCVLFDNLTKSLWAHNQNLLKNYIAFVWEIVIRSGQLFSNKVTPVMRCSMLSPIRLHRSWDDHGLIYAKANRLHLLCGEYRKKTTVASITFTPHNISYALETHFILVYIYIFSYWCTLILMINSFYRM